MKIKVSDIKREVSIQIVGNEPWLKGIYSCFQTSNGSKSAIIQANLTIARLVDDKFKATGTIFFDPFMPCSRCGEIAQWIIRDENIDVIFQEEETIVQTEEDRELLQEGLDNYYYHDEHIDLERFLDERIQLAIPYRNVPEDGETEHRCAIMPMTDEFAKKTGRDMPSRHNPFAILKDHIK